jgi:hypothetical protein
VLAGESAGGTWRSRALLGRDHGVAGTPCSCAARPDKWPTVDPPEGLRASYLGGDESLASVPRVSPGSPTAGHPPVVLGPGGLDPCARQTFSPRHGTADRGRSAALPASFPSIGHGGLSVAAASRAADRAADRCAGDLNEPVWEWDDRPEPRPYDSPKHGAAVWSPHALPVGRPR